MGRQMGLVAWSLCAATVLGATIELALVASSSGPLLTAHVLLNLGVQAGAAVPTAVVGALIVSRYPRHPIGWLFSIAAFGSAVGSTAGTYGQRVLLEGDLGALWAGQLAFRVSALLLNVYPLALIAMIFLLVPDGRLPSRRWWPALALPVLGLVLYWTAIMSLGPPIPTDDGKIIAGEVGALAPVLGPAGIVMVLLALLLAGVAVVRRLRRAHGEQRQQLRWIATSAVSLVVGALIAITSAATGGDQTPLLGVVPLVVAYVGLPVCTGVAILRYRLYDIDVIINRALVLAILATFVTAGYVTVVVLIGAVLGGRAEGRFWPSLLATAVVALAFQPIRKRVLRWADRLVYGERAVPYEALADFSRQIGAAASPSELLPLFAEAAARSVGARRARVHVDVPGTSGLSVSWPEGAQGADDQPGFQLAVRDRGELMGTVSVTMPPGRALRRDEQRLLERFAEQAGLALRNVRLEAELRARVDEAARQSNALEASRRRLLGARDAERQRVAATINRGVLARLEPLVPALESGWQAGPKEAADVLRRFDAATGATLDALREVTRGLFPAVLTRRGLVPALRAHLAKTGLTDVLRVPDSIEHRRFSPATEAAAYFCCLAAIEDMVWPACLELTLREGLLVLDVSGTPSDVTGLSDADGTRRDIGDAPLEEQPGSAERSFLADRVEAVGGRVWHDRGPNGALVMHAELPAAVQSGA